MFTIVYNLLKLMINQLKISYVFRGEIVVNFTAGYALSSTIYQIIEDETTPNAVLLASSPSLLRMYLNGSIENVVGNPSSHGYVVGVCDIIIDVNNFKLLQ